MNSPLLECLQGCKSILLMGAGGGYDIYCGLPLYHYLRARGCQVHLASLNFEAPGPSWGSSVAEGLAEIRAPEVVPPKIGAESCLAMWFASRGEDVPVYCFGAAGVQTILQHYQFLARHLQLDALVLLDGGTDSLLRGDEPGLGSPGEDLASLGAAHLLDLPTKLLVCLGFGLDFHHHVCHAYVLEAAAQLTAGGGFLGAFSLLPAMPEFQFLEQALHFTAARPEARVSIIVGSVVAAGRGEFGDHHVSVRTRGSELFINPLVSMYWGFQVDAVARRCLYLKELLPTRTRGEVTGVIQTFRAGQKSRPWFEMRL